METGRMRAEKVAPGMAPHSPVGDKRLLDRLGVPARTGDALYAMAYHNLAAGRADRAERLFCALCLLDPRRPESFLGYGICVARRGDKRHARALFALAEAARPDWAVPHFYLASIDVAEGRLAEARAALDRFFALKDGDVPRNLVADAERMRRFVSAGSDPRTSALRPG
jgi:cytochrome c-type biogenesis protein CcmH/NrfG